MLSNILYKTQNASSIIKHDVTLDTNDPQIKNDFSNKILFYLLFWYDFLTN